MIDIRQSKNYAVYLKSNGWTVERINGINYFFKKLPILGSILKLQRPEKINFETIKKLEKKYRVFQTIIESDLSSSVWTTKQNHDLLLHNGYKLSKSPFLPSKTLHLDLTKPIVFEKETRRCIKIGEESKIFEYNSPDEIKLFHRVWKKSVNFNRYVPSLQSLLNLKRSFPNNNSIFLTSHNAGAIFLRTKNIAYYWQAFTNKEGRASLSQYSLLFQGILWAKRMGCKIFDFEGIYDERFPNKSWLGFTHFKKSFGGTEILYPGCYIKFRTPF